MAKKVTVYSSPGCPHCIKAKEFLKSHNVAFEDIDVSSSQEKAREMVDKSGQMGVPTILVDKEVIVGFDQDKIKKSLGL